MIIHSAVKITLYSNAPTFLKAKEEFYDELLNMNLDKQADKLKQCDLERIRFYFGYFSLSIVKRIRDECYVLCLRLNRF